MTSSIANHHPHLKYIDHKELDALYWSVFIKGVGESFISIFTAIYLLSTGFSLRSVAIYYIIYFAALAVFSKTATRIGHSWGVKKTLALGIIILIGYYSMLAQIQSGLAYQLVAIVYGVGASLYYTSFQLDLARALRLKSSGRSLSALKILTILAGVVGPLIGAVFILKFSFGSLFILVAGILAVSVIPLLRRGDYRIEGTPPTVKEGLTFASKRKSGLYMLFGITEGAADILWPVFLYLSYPNLLSIGGIISFTTLAMIVLVTLAGRLADKNQLRAFKIGTISQAPTWVLRLLWLSPVGLLFGNLLGSVTNALVGITIDQDMYREAKSTVNAAPALLFRFYYSAIGRIGILLLAVITGNSSILFVVVALIVLLMLTVAPRTDRQNEAQ